MNQRWKWSLREALSIIRQTYADDWGKGIKERAAFLEDSSISVIEQSDITGLQAGGGEKAVIFIHGSPANAMRWASYLENVSDGYKYISIDRMGFGERKHQAPDLEKDLKILSDYIATFKEPILVAHSLAGAMVLRLAAQNDIGGMVLVATSLDPALEKTLFVQKLVNFPPISWLLSRSVRHSNIEMAQLQGFMEKTESDLSKITAPTHIVHPKDDNLVSHAHVAYAKDKLVNVKEIQITNPDEGGHSIPWTHQELITQAIKSVSAPIAEAA